jgi:hypothetical protein
VEGRRTGRGPSASIAAVQLGGLGPALFVGGRLQFPAGELQAGPGVQLQACGQGSHALAGLGPGSGPPTAFWRPWSRRSPPYPPGTAEDGGLQAAFAALSPGAGGLRRIPQVPPRTAGSRRRSPRCPLEPAVSAVSPRYRRGRRAPGGVRRIVPWSRRSPPYPPGTAVH